MKIYCFYDYNYYEITKTSSIEIGVFINDYDAKLYMETKNKVLASTLKENERKFPDSTGTITGKFRIDDGQIIKLNIIQEMEVDEKFDGRNFNYDYPFEFFKSKQKELQSKCEYLAELTKQIWNTSNFDKSHIKK